MKGYEKVFTPEEARNIIVNRNENYRKLKRDKAMEYAKDMAAGKWCEDNGEPITFYENGNLANGQHRLYAVAESGVNIKFFVIEGISKEATETIDVGFKRSSEDAIRYKLRGTGKDLTKGAFGVAKQVMTLRKHGKTNNQSPYKVGKTEVEARETYLADIDGFNEAAIFGAKIKKDAKIIKMNEAGSIFYYLTHDIGINPWYVKDYFNKLASAARNDKSIFNTTMTNISQKGLSSSGRYDELIWGWNSCIRGCDKKRCQYSGWFEIPSDKSFFGNDNISSLTSCVGVGLSEKDAEMPVLREVH
jgi:hypothetical protein